MLALKEKQEKKKGNTKNAQHDEHLGKSAIRIRLYVVVSERDLEKKKRRKESRSCLPRHTFLAGQQTSVA